MDKSYTDIKMSHEAGNSPTKETIDYLIARIEAGLADINRWCLYGVIDSQTTAKSMTAALMGIDSESDLKT